MRVVITGGAGFLGSHLCGHFLNEGHKVVCVGTFNRGFNLIQDLLHDPNFTTKVFDVNNTLRFSEFSGADYILHFASFPSPKDHMLMPIKSLLTDSNGTQTMLEVAKATGALFLLASTSHILSTVEPTKETSIYSEGKRFAEALTATYNRQFGVNTRIVRMFNSYGPGMRLDDGRVVPTFIVKALKGETLELFGVGQLISLCYVDDMIDAILRVISSGSHKPISVGGVRVSIKTLAERIVKLSGSKSEIVFHSQYREDELEPNNSVINELGWRQTIQLDEGLIRTIEDFRRRMEDVYKVEGFESSSYASQR